MVLGAVDSRDADVEKCSQFWFCECDDVVGVTVPVGYEWGFCFAEWLAVYVVAF